MQRRAMQPKDGLCGLTSKVSGMGLAENTTPPPETVDNCSDSSAREKD